MASQTGLSPLSYRAMLKPVLRAYAFAYLSSASPRILGLILSALRGKLSYDRAITKCKSALKQEARIDRLPTAFAVLVGGATLLPEILDRFIARYILPSRVAHLFRAYKDRTVKFAIAFVSALVCFHLLNLYPSRPIGPGPESDNSASSTDSQHHSTSVEGQRRRRRRSSVALASDEHFAAAGIPILAGKTMDLTTFAVVRASGILLHYGWRRRRNLSSKLHRFMQTLAAPSAFAMSSFIIMWNWFYSPDRLPYSYHNWISSAAQIDHRLIEALRQCRFGTFIYGKDTGMAPLLGSLAKELGYPEEWGDPAKAIPIPCELYHSGAGASCEWHAIRRFISSWKFSMKMYVPLNIIMLSRRQPSARSFRRAVTEASQSSAFLAAFVALFYYGVCLARTRLGPNLFSRETYTAQMCDGGICVGVGCMACGWSILLEKPARRSEIAFFVGPRALSTVLPRRYDRKYMRREQIAFAASAATILTAAQSDPSAIHGVFGRLLAQIYS